MTLTPQQREEIKKKYFSTSVDDFDEDAVRQVIRDRKSALAPQAPIEEQKVGLGQKILNAAGKVSNFFGAKGITDQFGSDIARARASNTLEESLVEAPSFKEGIGSALQFGANFLPGAGVGASLARKTAVGLGTGYAFDVGSKLQTGQEQPLKPGLGTAIGGVLPIGGAGIGYAGRVMGRLFKGLGSGLSGVSTKTLDEMLNNPKVAQQATDKLNKSGNFKVIEKNAKSIVDGVSKIRQEARQAYGKGLESLAETDIKPAVFRAQTQQVLDKYGVTGSKSARQLIGVEFDNPKNIKKASELIDKLHNAELNGRSLRKLANDIESSAYKTTGTDAERLSFNVFVDDLSEALKSAISNSTNKLNDINAKFSQDMQLAEGAQKIFGKVNYKNVSEISNAARKLEGLFNQKGLDPKITDDFLTRIGISPKDFRASEAVRQITNKEPMPPNAPGFNIGEIVRTTTGSIMTPETIRNLTIKTGLAKEKLLPFLNGLQTLSPALQKTLIQALLKNPE